MNNMYDDDYCEEENYPKGIRAKHQPENKSCSSDCFGLIGLMISIFWLLNLGCGIIEIPDCLPIIGHLDEIFFTIILLASLSSLRIEIPLLSRLANNYNNYID